MRKNLLIFFTPGICSGSATICRMFRDAFQWYFLLCGQISPEPSGQLGKQLINRQGEDAL
jgi:hypothetical protein